jgi:hypothetical protein
MQGIAYIFKSGSYVGVPEFNNLNNSLNPPQITSSWGQTANIDTLWITYMAVGTNFNNSNPVRPRFFPNGSDDYLGLSAGSEATLDVVHFYNRESSIDPSPWIRFTTEALSLCVGTIAIQGTPFTGSYMLTSLTGSGRNIVSFGSTGGSAIVN